MKIKRNFIAIPIVGMFLFSLPVSSKSFENVEVEMVENERAVIMEVKNENLLSINVSLFTNNEREIFSERVENGETFESKIDFEGLRNGRYTLVSQIGNMKVNKVLEVKDTQVELVDRYYSYVPTFAQEGDLLTVYYINDMSAAIGVSIEDDFYSYLDTYYDSSDNTIFKKVYSLKNLEPGTYQFNMTSKGEFFTHEFEVE